MRISARKKNSIQRDCMIALAIVGKVLLIVLFQALTQ